MWLQNLAAKNACVGQLISYSSPMSCVSTPAFSNVWTYLRKLRFKASEVWGEMSLLSAVAYKVANRSISFQPSHNYALLSMCGAGEAFQLPSAWRCDIYHTSQTSNNLKYRTRSPEGKFSSMFPCNNGMIRYYTKGAPIIT